MDLPLVPLWAATPAGASAAARVMSPVAAPNEGILTGMHAMCQQCQQATYEPAVCARCGLIGHPVCLGLERYTEAHAKALLKRQGL